MPLSFIDKKKRWPPPKPVQYILAVIALIAAVAILAAWLFIRFVYTDPTKGKEKDDATLPSVQDVLPGVAYCVIVIEDEDLERFAIVKAEPEKNSITVSPIDPSLSVNNATLSSTLHKNGVAQTVSAISALMDVPVSHYLSFSVSDVLDLTIDLGDNLPFTLAEDITYQDENAAAVHLSAGKHNLTPKQITSLLRYSQWNDSENYHNLVADLTIAFINYYMVPDCSLLQYFKLLSKSAVTDIRIDHFNSYQSGLEHLASSNTGSLAQRSPLIYP